MTSIVNAFAAWLYQVGYSEGTQHMLPACAREFLEQQQITTYRIYRTAAGQGLLCVVTNTALKKT